MAEVAKRSFSMSITKSIVHSRYLDYLVNKWSHDLDNFLLILLFISSLNSRDILRFKTHHKSRFSHVNVFFRHYGGQLKTAVEREVGEKIYCKR